MRLLRLVVPTLLASTAALTLTVGTVPAQALPAVPGAHPPAAEAEAELLRLVTAERAKAKCADSAPSGPLARASRAHSQDMATHGYFAHNAQDGTTPARRAQRQDYYSWGGEAISGRATPAEVVGSLLGVAGPRRTLLDCAQKAIGVGVAWNAAGKPYWTLNLGTRNVPDHLPADQVEREVARLVNAERTKGGCPAVRWDDRLSRASRLHSQDMAARNYFSHENPEKQGPGERADRQGYQGWSGENIAAGWATMPAAEAVKLWMNSKPHHDNMMTCGHQALGMGVGWRDDASYWTLNFGSR